VVSCKNCAHAYKTHNNSGLWAFASKPLLTTSPQKHQKTAKKGGDGK